MNQTYVIQNLRLNRSVGWAFLFYSMLILLAQGPHPGLSPVMVGIPLAFLTLSFLILNQGMLKFVKRLPESESLTVEKMSLFLPLTGAALIGLAYLLTGHWVVLFFMMLPIFQADIFGHARVAKALFTVQISLICITFFFGYPRLPNAQETWFNILLFVPMIYCFYLFGTVIAGMVLTTSTQVLRLQSLAATDGLTGLINRRQFNHRLLSEISRARRNKSPVSLALFDIDDFKKINDFYGHPVGDRILKELGHLIASNVRDSDVAARYGGEEFALILPDTHLNEATDILERLRMLIARQVFCLPDNPMTAAVSVGIAQLDWNNHTSFELVEQADSALYEAKRHGKNQVVAHPFAAAPAKSAASNTYSSGKS